MSTYAVFGMARHRALQIAREAVYKQALADKEFLPQSIWVERSEAAADEIMKGRKTVQLSEMFDAPEFAQQFKDIAERDGAVRLHIKARRRIDDKEKPSGYRLVWEEA